MTVVPEDFNPSNEALKHAVRQIEVVTDEGEDRISEYETINENEMLPFLSSLTFDDHDLNIDRDTIATIHSSKSENTSSSENSYLQVIDDDSYLHHYQSMEIRTEPELVHVYSTISAINYLDLCFPKLSNSPFEELSDCVSEKKFEKDQLLSPAHFEVYELATSEIIDIREKLMLPTSNSHSELPQSKPDSFEILTVQHGIDSE